MSSASYASLVTRPDVITEPGNYITRRGETVSITVASAKQDHGCVGHYPEGTPDRWHKSGRLYFHIQCENDIVRRADSREY
jgi:hypothetical protein